MDGYKHRYWYEFLKRSEEYKRCCLEAGSGPLEALYQDFGDVHNLSWPEWWEQYKGLFLGIESAFVIDEVKTKKQFEELFDEGDENLTALIVNLLEPKATILKKMEEILGSVVRRKLRFENKRRKSLDPEAHMKKRLGRPKFDPSFYHRYGLTPVPGSRQIEAFKIMLRVYDACIVEDRKPRGVKKKTRYEIGDALELIIVQRKDKKDLGVPDEESRRKTMTATVGRYYLKAKKLIENTEMGAFPSRI